MNKNLFALAVLFCALLVFGACSKDDNEVDEEWKAYNEGLLKRVIDSGEYASLKSLSGNGYIYRKKTNFFEDDSYPSPVITDSITPLSTDSVVVRYEGWYLLEDGTKYIFDSTEKNNAKNGRGFVISGMDSDGSYTGVVDGWVTALINMKAGESYEICLPYRLGYGAAGNYDYYTGTQTIPGYTTLWFNIKLLKVVQDKAN